MLRILKANEFDKYAEYAYQLALNQASSSYPTYADGIKTREEFMELATQGCGDNPDSRILLFEHGDMVKGWIHYYTDRQDKCLFFHSFNTEEYTKEAITEFLTYAKAQYPGFSIDFGFPTANKQAIDTLTQMDFTNIETSHVNILKFADYEFQKEEPGVIPVTEDNFALFKQLHDPISSDMYWNSERLCEAYFKPNSPWHLYLSTKEGMVEGCIYFVFAGNIMEIFGIDFPNDEFDETVTQKFLTKALNYSKQSGKVDYMYFFTETEDEQAVVSHVGMKHIGNYKLFRGVL